MYPNPQDVLPLPPRPDLAHYRKRAKELVRAAREGDDAILTWTRGWIARLLELQPGAATVSPRDAERHVRDVAAYARDRLTASARPLSQAQLVIARAHGFASWTRLVRHVEDLERADASPFERCVEAIVSGDLDELRTLLAAHPGVVRERSDREHRATLLHYVSANGVENYRQRTPANVVAIAHTLLDAGAEVDAEADVYGGGATTLGLVVTSAHPRAAGVQTELADLLMDHGARVDARIVWACLANGCPEAAAHMADRGAPLELREAAGIGRLEVLARALEEPGAPTSDAAAAGLVMAAWYGGVEAVRLMLDAGVPVDARPRADGQTALHVAAYQGDVDLTRELIGRGAPVDAEDAVYGTPPLVWALHAWLVDGREGDDAYRAVLRTLAEAGAHVRSEWIEDERVRADAELHALLRERAEREDVPDLG